MNLKQDGGGGEGEGGGGKGGGDGGGGGGEGGGEGGHEGGACGGGGASGVKPTVVSAVFICESAAFSSEISVDTLFACSSIFL